jgi:molybdopterin/thiamine biosynthesis adenylyltransferase
VILTREQINRFLRHIIIPEISGPGQKKLSESAVFVCGENANDIAPLVYYLAAMGIGRIYCHLDDAREADKLFTGIHDLNGDVSVELAEGSKSDVRIFLGTPEFMSKNKERISTGFVPSIISLYSGWKGSLEVFKNIDNWNSFLTRLSEELSASQVVPHDDNRNGEIISTCFIGTLCATEVVKFVLGIGETADDFLYFDLLAMEFSKIDKAELKTTLKKLCARKGPDGPEGKLADRRVLIVGAGGLGCPVAYALTLAGVGTIGMVDYDSVEISNLQRQILHAKSRMGLPKVDSAAVFLKSINPELKFIGYNTSLSKENVFDIIKDYDVVVDALDNFPTRFLLNDACFFAKKPLVDAGVIRFDGIGMTILNPGGPCYRCTYPDMPSPGSTPSCSEVGVLGSVPGVMGFIQSAEVVKLLTGQGNLLSDRIIFFDGLFANFCTMKLAKRSTCPLCGTDPKIHELQEYTFVCADSVHE